MKILHTADWHIGSFKGPEKEGVNLRSEDTMKCLRSLVETAEKEKPDLVLVSGDIFHQAEIWQGRSHKEVLQAREIILALSREEKHWYQYRDEVYEKIATQWCERYKIDIVE